MTVIKLTPGYQHVCDNFNGIGMCAADRFAREVVRCDAYPAGNKLDDVAHHNVALNNYMR
jgi:hypothetical protein